MKLNNEHMDNRKLIQQELEELAPTLAKLSKKDIVEVPGYYFNTIGDKMMRKIQAEPVKKSWLDVFEQYMQQLLSPVVLKVSLLLVVVATVGVNIYKYNTATVAIASDSLSFAELTEDDLELLLTDNSFSSTGYLLSDADLSAMGSEDIFITLGGNIEDDQFNNLDIDEMYDELILEELL